MKIKARRRETLADMRLVTGAWLPEINFRTLKGTVGMFAVSSCLQLKDMEKDVIS